ncbi:MAG: topoisomerase DNA-binding C4 zinc finger domain-containing protein [Firmicutes bacterium]|jgi:ssDNA-binding Zn-finger/Zn-ribbon topoisomerase 1|uniref:DNA topoisomerase type IA zn finger domain-containing protein n=1 Tax=Sulfobacillus benefaciens TaxID=453960 RepID=A0A2T2XAB8_9FIRM|nr:topoisomerase DNA-binding C4 zinc finger domain-containing protein [Bacillota bacterium]MCL5014357.1 topoisomerase DNA-binding C4 zinc finger domain-containing protein [Bacillota bacterium]PSR31463.1 MAG: hypothetical protein C7B43_01840 [Sulfobacillus benefaciens]HBQ96110.1 hypothetical protein [Sulfobacillus sp.]
MRCPLCQDGSLHEWEDDRGQIHIGCSNYPKCRFDAASWDDVSNMLARFRHPLAPNQL